MTSLFFLIVLCTAATYVKGQQTISPTSITGEAGENVTIECTSDRPGEAVNNALRIYRSALDTFEGFENSPEAEERLDRVDSGDLTTYTFGPLRPSDDGTILICTSSGATSGNATITVTPGPTTAPEPTTIMRTEMGMETTTTAGAALVYGMHTVITMLLMMLISLLL